MNDTPRELILQKLQLMAFFRKTAMLYGVACGLAFGFPLFASELIPSPLLRCIAAVAILLFGMAGACELADKKMRRFNAMLYTELEPERFLDEFIPELYSRKPEKWNALAVVYIGQAYHASGRYKEAEALYLGWLNNVSRVQAAEIELKNQLGIVGRLAILYSDAGNRAGAEKAFARFKEIAAKVELNGAEREFPDLVYNCYLRSVGRIEDCLGYFEWRRENAPNELVRITAHFRLAEVYAEGGYHEEALREYRTVADEGRALHAARIAREKIK